MWNITVLCNTCTLLALWNNLCATVSANTCCHNRPDLVSFTEICPQIFTFSIKEFSPSFLWDETKPLWEFIISIFVCNASIFRAGVRFPGCSWVTACWWKGRPGIRSSVVLCVSVYVQQLSVFWGKFREPLEEGLALSRGASHSPVCWLIDTWRRVWVNLLLVTAVSWD